jgi:hypothetical protein
MVSSLTLDEYSRHTLCDRQLEDSRGRKNKFAGLAGILMSEWRSAVLRRKSVGSEDFVTNRTRGD